MILQMLPPVSVRKFGKTLFDIAVLELPNGATWEVRLKKHNSGRVVSLSGQGWAEFVQDNSVGPGFFMVFDYNGNHGGKSSFNVQIFSTTAGEISYLQNLSDTVTSAEEEAEVEEGGDQESNHSEADSVEILESFPHTRIQTETSRPKSGTL